VHQSPKFIKGERNQRNKSARGRERRKNLLFIYCTLTKKEKEFFLLCREIQMGSVPKSYMRKDFQIYE
jgi:hypothetical protein